MVSRFVPLLIAILTILQIPAMGAVLHVSTQGDDSAAGTADSPFHTIQKAAKTLKSGDTCIVHAGTYRETVSPVNSGTAEAPVRFIAAADEKVVITGAEPVNGWIGYKDGIYMAKADWSIQQVFVNRSLMTPARYPDADTDPYERKVVNVKIESGVCTLEDAGFVEGFWKDGYIRGMAPREWVAVTAPIASSAGSTISVGGNPPFKGDGTAYFYGSLGALDAPKEWHHEDGKLYLRPPAGVKIKDSLVEATKRRWAFDLSGRSHIEIKGFEIFAASINFDDAENCVMDSCSARFTSFDYVMRGGFNRDKGINIESEGLGIALGGSGNTIRNSIVAYCIGDGISIYGSDNRVENCVIHDCDTSASDCAPINATGEGHVIKNCTVFNGGRSLIVHRKLRRGRIEHNHLYNAGLMTNDLGATYAFTTDGKGTVIAFNRVHDVHCHTGVGIYVDNFSPNHIVHHNLCYDCEDCGLRLNTPTSNVQIYNNTFTRNGRSFGWWGRNNNSKMDGSVLANNIMTDAVSLGEGSKATHNYTGDAPGFVDPDDNDFRLTDNSPCIDEGKVIEDIAKDFEGKAPDQGCFEHSREPWTAGSTLDRSVWLETGF